MMAVSPTDKGNEPTGQRADIDESMDFDHVPVMLAEITELAGSLGPGVFLDATLGGGGHTQAILDVNDGLSVLGLDQDPFAVRSTKARLESYGSRLAIEQVRFDNLDTVLARSPLTNADSPQGKSGRPGTLQGFLFDLGVSSPQLDRADRGFSFRNDGPLDMRMDTTQALTADEVVNQYPVEELASILRRNADERFAYRIAQAIVAARPIATTAKLAEIVAAAIPAPARRTGGHPARRSFQAIRIEVNAELDVLRPALSAALDALVVGGKGIVLTYHSAEDRIAKHEFRDRSTVERPPGLPIGGPEPSFSVLRPAVRRATAEEVERNPRASSARLRSIERIAA